MKLTPGQMRYRRRLAARKLVALTIELDADDHRVLQQTAITSERSLGAVVRLAVRQYLAEHVAAERSAVA